LRKNGERRERHKGIKENKSRLRKKESSQSNILLSKEAVYRQISTRLIKKRADRPMMSKIGGSK
jgi:hypothetical protein